MDNFNQKPATPARPVIGISGDILTGDGVDRHAVRDSYIAAVLNAGGAPLIIPCTGHEAAAYAIYRTLDGLLLTGGADVQPDLYGESQNGTEMDSVEPRRDATELWLARWAIADDLPLLGICRGHQVLNVALGGTLFQDIPLQLPESSLDHRGSTYTSDRGLLAHQVVLEPQCKLSAIFGTSQLMVNSLHHQSVKQVAQGLKVVGRSPDGVVEALESDNHRWVASIQWHPEELWRQHSSAANLFKAFVEAASVGSRQLSRV